MTSHRQRWQRQCARRPKNRSLRPPVGDAHCARKQGCKVVLGSNVTCQQQDFWPQETVGPTTNEPLGLLQRILYLAVDAHFRPFQSVFNAPAHIAVRKRTCDVTASHRPCAMISTAWLQVRELSLSPPNLALITVES